MPHVVLASAARQAVDFGDLSGQTVIYCYPMTGRPGVLLPEDWDMIPGARGCTPQACAFRDHHEELRALGTEVLGISTQTSDYQREAVDRLGLPFTLLSDHELLLTKPVGLPTFEVDEMVLLKRLTLVLHAGVIQRVFYPVFPPDRHAGEVVEWLRHGAMGVG